jgi:hypothetical protein
MKAKIIGGVIVAEIIIAVATSNNKKAAPDAAAITTAPAVANTTTTVPSVPLTGKTAGTWQDPAGCIGCGDLVSYIRVDSIWCGWQGDNVIVHARFHNGSVEHVTVHWHPSYTIAGGDAHGTGLSSVQSSGLDAGATRGVYVKQQPKGVTPGSPIGLCDPAFEDVKSG